jgi:hypothetical protein
MQRPEQDLSSLARRVKPCRLAEAIWGRLPEVEEGFRSSTCRVVSPSV